MRIRFICVSMRGWILVIGLLGASAVSADILILKEGQRIDGEASLQGGTYEVKTPYGVLRVAKAEVAKVVRSVEVFEAEAESYHRKARVLYEEAIRAQADPNVVNAKLKEALSILDQAIGLYAEARETYADDRFARLDEAPLKLLQEKRLYRDKMTVEGAVPAAKADGATQAPEATPVKPTPAPSEAKLSAPAGSEAKKARVESDYTALKAKADAGDVDAQFELGDRLYVDRKYADAIPWLRKAADRGHAAALTRSGVALYYGEGVGQNYTEAAKLFRRGFTGGDPLGAYHLGAYYNDGLACKRNLSLADDWFDKSLRGVRSQAEKGHARYQLALGYMYTYGLGVDEDQKEAVRWTRLAAQQGYPTAQNNLGASYMEGVGGLPKDPAEGERWYRRAAEKGDSIAMFNLGALAAAQKQYSEAISWYRKGAEAGNPEAQYELAYIYAEGKGTPKNYDEALKWFRRSAEQGYDPSMTYLGYLYHHGEGVTKSIPEAVKWYKQAASRDNFAAINNLGNLLDQMKNYPEAIKWFTRAAAMGNPLAAYNLGCMHEYGRGVRKNLASARQWYLVAAQQGNELAQKRLKEIGLK